MDAIRLKAAFPFAWGEGKGRIESVRSLVLGRDGNARGVSCQTKKEWRMPIS